MATTRSLYSIITIAILVVAQNTHADVTAWSTDRPDNPTNISIVGSITAADVKKVAAAIRGSVQKIDQGIELHVWLDSTGGDVEAAMAIGRLIRTKTARIDVLHFSMTDGRVDTKPFYGRDFSVCASSCVLILASGSMRSCGLKGTRVGIHRPYSTSSVGPGQDTRKNYAALAARVRSYLEEMGMPNSLYEAMMAVAAEHVQWLSSSDCVAFQLHATDVAYTDYLDSRDASVRGISKQEFLRRKAMAEQECTPILARFTNSFYDTTLIKFNECVQRIENSGNP